MTLNRIRQICMTGLPVLLTVASLLHFDIFFPDVFDPGLLNAFYTIILTANIGYFTNYVAIKMLFKPYYKTAFGRQGLIPKNQDKLASSLSETLIDNFLSKQQWHEYLVHSNLVNIVLSEAKQGSFNWLKQAKNSLLFNHFVIDYLTQHKTSINQNLTNIQSNLVQDFSKTLNSEELLGKGFAWLEEQFEQNPTQMQSMIEPIIKTVAENIPQIANGLVKAIDDHIEEQDTIKRGIAKMARWTADFSVDDIKHYLFRMVASFEFRETLFEGLKSLLTEYKNKPFIDPVDSSSQELNNGVGGNSISLMIEQLINSNLGSINWVEILINRLAPVNQDTHIEPSNKNHAEQLIDLQKILLSLHQELFEKIEAELADGPLHQWIVDGLVSMIEKLDLKRLVKNKAADFSPKKLESVFQDMISEQLVFIELLGAVLGALSGLALIDIKIFAVLATLLATFYLADNFFTARK